MKSLAILLFAGAVSVFAAPSPAFGSEKAYQVTGQVLEVTNSKIIVDKNGEKFEMARKPDTKVKGKLEVGSKVTAHYSITATEVEVKAPPSAKGAKK